MIDISQLWFKPQEQQWKNVLEVDYWDLVKDKNRLIEKEFERFDTNKLKAMNAEEWFEFLEEKYFRWKYTADNRYATTTGSLRKYKHAPDGLDELYMIKGNLFYFNTDNISLGLKIASSIKGLGMAGASGLLAVIFPEKFSTVDQFVAKHLNEINITNVKNDQNITNKEAISMIEAMRKKACELNSLFGTTEWTPRKIDKVLWAIR